MTAVQEPQPDQTQPMERPSQPHVI